MTANKSLRSIITLSLALLVLFGYSFISAWAPPAGAPPDDNVEAPINVGSTAQDKAGTLTTAKLGVISNGPSLELIDATADEKDWRLAVEAGVNLVFRADRNQNGEWGDDSTHPLFLHSGDDTAGDYAVFSNQIRATEYCDKSGRNCFPNEMPDTGPLDGTDESSSAEDSLVSQGCLIREGTDQKYNDGGNNQWLSCPINTYVAAYNQNGSTITPDLMCCPLSGIKTRRECVVEFAYDIDTSPSVDSTTPGRTQLTFNEGDIMSIETYIGTQEYDDVYYTEHFQSYGWYPGSVLANPYYWISNGYTSPEDYARSKSFLDAAASATAANSSYKGMQAAVFEVKPGAWAGLGERSYDGRTTQMNARVISCE